MEGGSGKIIEWRGRHFSVAEGSLHPAYSLHTFDEEREFREEHWKVKEGDVVFDVGASYGAYALCACSDGATVHAFEPEPSVWADLMLNVELNGWNSRFFGACCGLWSELRRQGIKVDSKADAKPDPAGGADKTEEAARVIETFVRGSSIFRAPEPLLL